MFIQFPGFFFLGRNITPWVINDAGLSHSDDVLPIYIGDDRTDEDAFKVGVWFFNIIMAHNPAIALAFHLLTTLQFGLPGPTGAEQRLWHFSVIGAKRIQCLVLFERPK